MERNLIAKVLRKILIEMRKFNVLFLLAMILFVACGQAKVENSTKINKCISEEKAIELAEEYIRYQGYTFLETDLKFDDAIIEEGEYASNIENLLQSRKNTLQAKAWEARLFDKKSKWAVGFNFYNLEPNVGKCVFMDTLGNEIIMRSGEIRMDWLLQDLPLEEQQAKMDGLFDAAN